MADSVLTIKTKKKFTLFGFLKKENTLYEKGDIKITEKKNKVKLTLGNKKSNSKSEVTVDVNKGINLIFNFFGSLK